MVKKERVIGIYKKKLLEVKNVKFLFNKHNRKYLVKKNTTLNMLKTLILKQFLKKGSHDCMIFASAP